MLDSNADLASAARLARERLAADATTSARLNTGPGSAGDIERVMADSAQAAIFAEALLGAIRARLAEFKTVTKQ